jgi:hypothetical protein
MSIQDVVGRARNLAGRRAALQSDREARIAELSHLLYVRDVETAAFRARSNRELALR